MLHEVKSGYVRGYRARRQFEKDLMILKAEQAQSVTWHFFQSSISGKMGPSRTFLRQLEEIAARSEADYTIVVHLAP